jgi:hypothetical protein
VSIGEYFTIFAAMLVGLAVADLSLSLHRLIRAGKSIKWDWLTPAAAFVTLCYILNLWWGFYFAYNELERINFGWFMLDVAILLVLFLMAAAVLPDDKPEQGFSLRQYYWNSCGHFWSMHAIYMVLVAIKNVQLQQRLDATFQDYLSVSVPMATIALFSLLLIRFRPVWLHALMIAMIVYTIVTQWVFYTLG